ncbi:MAG: ParM/StbA family protein [Clostridiales bacterium]|nr:ParM/StbA family protein [Clostridiales bacterium]
MYQKETGDIIIGIDHGYSTTKTVDMIMKNGVKKCKSKPAMEENTLLWKGQYYKVGEGNLDFTESKVADESLYVNTLATIGKIAKKHQICRMNVILGTGLPFARHGEEKELFRNYFNQRSIAEFEYEGWSVNLYIKAVYVFKQGYAAAYGKLRGKDADCYLVDIGSRTLDCVHIRKGMALESDSFTQQDGLRYVYQKIKGAVYSKTGKSIPDARIDDYISGVRGGMTPEYEDIIQEQLQEYADHVEALLREHNIEFDFHRIVYVGGGASIMEEYAQHKYGNVECWLDVRENARGYERALIDYSEKGML